jgi:hypothetical protein
LLQRNARLADDQSGDETDVACLLDSHPASQPGLLPEGGDDEQARGLRGGLDELKGVDEAEGGKGVELGEGAQGAVELPKSDRAIPRTCARSSA